MNIPIVYIKHCVTNDIPNKIYLNLSDTSVYRYPSWNNNVTNDKFSKSDKANTGIIKYIDNFGLFLVFMKNILDTISNSIMYPKDIKKKVSVLMFL